MLYENYSGSIIEVSQLQFVLEKSRGMGIRTLGVFLNRDIFKGIILNTWINVGITLQSW